jgi:hypothetical protein
MVVLLLQAVPCFLYFGKSAMTDAAWRTWIFVSMASIAIVSLAACLVPMSFGLKAVRRLEV